jgi:hypothetical protein
MVRRWAKLEKDFLNKSGVFDISKIPDIYDCIKYDLLHNINILQLEQAEELYTYAKNLADVVIPQVNGDDVVASAAIVVAPASVVVALAAVVVALAVVVVNNDNADVDVKTLFFMNKEKKQTRKSRARKDEESQKCLNINDLVHERKRKEKSKAKKIMSLKIAFHVEKENVENKLSLNLQENKKKGEKYHRKN